MTSRNNAIFLTLVIAVMGSAFLTTRHVAAAESVLKVVTTLPDYADLVRRIGGDRVSAQSIVLGDQDAHFIRPKPSFAAAVAEADVLVSTGLDLELWLPAVVDKTGNARVRTGQIGFVAAAQGMNLVEKPSAKSRAEGGVHVFGNPHVTTSPINMKVAAENIASGLAANDPDGKEIYETNLKAFLAEVDRRLFGESLVKLLGGPTLCKMAEKGRLQAFLEKHEYKGKPLASYAGGWWKKMAPLRGKRIVTYHKNWAYFFRLFGVVEAGTVEPKPGIPPSPRHVSDLIEAMNREGVKLLLSANYFSEAKVKSVADKTGAEAIIVPLYVGGAEGADDVLSLFDLWIDSILTAAKKAGVVG